MRVPSSILRRLLAGLAVLASGGVVMSSGAYGAPEPGRDPRVTIAEFSYTPGTTVTRGANLVFQVTLDRVPRPQYCQDVRVEFDTTPWPLDTNGLWFGLSLYDDGLAPDATAGDGIYTGAWDVPEDSPLGGPVPVGAYYCGIEATAAGFTVVAED